MKKFTGYFIVLALMLFEFSSSCYKVLDQKPTDRYTSAVVWQDSFLVKSYLAQLYDLVPVMVNDAPTIMHSYSSTPLNQDHGHSLTYVLGYSEQVEGPIRMLGMADETKYSFGAQSNVVGIKEKGVQVGGTLLDWWGNAYYSIRNLNSFIQNGKASSFSQAEEMIAEARFLRAFAYFAMVKRYGGVPLETKALPINSDSSLLYPKRSSEKEVYDYILHETQDISKILPPTNERGRATKWAALALRSRAALFAGSIANFGSQELNGLLGFPKSDAENYYQIAYNSCKEIINSGIFSLYNGDPINKIQNYKSIFLKKEDNPEKIMVWPHNGSGFTEGGHDLWSWDMCETPRPQLWGLGNYNEPYLEMAESFDLVDGSSGKLNRSLVKSKEWTMDELWGGRDPRFYADIWTNGTSWPGAIGGPLGENTIDMHDGIRTANNTILDGRNDVYKGMPVVGDELVRYREFNVPNTGFGVMKYLDSTANNQIWYVESHTDYIIFRYAEILLNYAEAAFNIGKTEEALNAINQIRDRAGVADLNTMTREDIRHERRVELCFEDKRYWDLRRWRIAVQKLTRTYSGIRYIYDPSTKKYIIKFVDNVDGKTDTPTFPSKNYYWPVPQGQLSADPNLIQNPGY